LPSHQYELHTQPHQHTDYHATDHQALVASSCASPACGGAMATTSRKLTGAPARPSDITPVDGTLPTAGRFPGDASLSLAAAAGRRVPARAHDAAVLL